MLHNLRTAVSATFASLLIGSFFIAAATMPAMTSASGALLA